jgi:hypothetical protein
MNEAAKYILLELGKYALKEGPGVVESFFKSRPDLDRSIIEKLDGPSLVKRKPSKGGAK